MKRVWIAGVAAVIALAAVRVGAEPAPASQPAVSASEIAQAIQRLGSGQFKERQIAGGVLRRAGSCRRRSDTG